MAIAIAAAKIYNIDLSKAIEAKIRYNELRGQNMEKILIQLICKRKLLI